MSQKDIGFLVFLILLFGAGFSLLVFFIAPTKWLDKIFGRKGKDK